jgi:AraC-like DNA-binding protein
MKQRNYNPEPLVLQEGYFLDKYYSNYEMLVLSTKNWKYNCMYQLKPNALSGHHRILQLSTMQLAYVTRPGGTMHDTYSALDSISVAVIEKCADKACFDCTKLEVGDIIFFDNTHPYRFVTNNSISFIIMNININILSGLQAKISQAFNHKIKDIHGAFSTLLNETWDQFTNISEQKRDKHSYKEAEKKILALLETLLDTQDLKISKLTKGEKVALAIRDQVYAHMDGKVNIASLARQHNVSEGTLQNSFKSLFGFTPKNFLRQMKLNLVYRDLKEADIEYETVSNVARRWGFMHMGHFSNYYTELFGENPSQTLKTPYLPENSMSGECVERQEEME